MAKRILVPLDQQERTEAVLPLVADMARAGGATVRLLHVAPVPQVRHDTAGRVIAYANQEGERLEGRALDYLRTVEAQLEGVPVEHRVRFGRPGAEILLEADVFDADLIALTAPPRRWRPWTPFGGVSGRVRRRAAVSVMFLTPRGAR